MNSRQSVSKFISRDLYNVAIASFPSRRVRNLWIRSQFGVVGESAVVCLRVRFLEPGGICLGDRSVVGSDSLLDGRGGLTIGSDVDIAPSCQIWTLEHDPNSSTHAVREGSVVVGDHTWIASRSTILPGVTIGRGAVVAAGSVVVKDVGERQMVGGSPAKHIGWRDNPLTYKLSYGGRFR